MADIRLAKPQANTAQTVPCAADSRFDSMTPGCI